MYCIQCGEEIPNDAVFCCYCGKPQNDKVKQVNVKQIHVETHSDGTNFDASSIDKATMDELHQEFENAFGMKDVAYEYKDGFYKLYSTKFRMFSGDYKNIRMVPGFLEKFFIDRGFSKKISVGC